MAPPSTTTTTEADIIQNKLNLLFASRQRLLDTWLPPRTPQEERCQAMEQEDEEEDEDNFQSIPTRYVLAHV